MAMKLFFMDELQNIKNESLKSVKIRNTSTNMDHGTVNSLQTKIKQKLIDSILEHNCDLIQTQNVFVQYHSVTRKINDKIISHTNTNNALRNDKKMSQTSQRMADLKNYKLVLKIFILRPINRK